MLLRCRTEKKWGGATRRPSLLYLSGWRLSLFLCASRLVTAASLSLSLFKLALSLSSFLPCPLMPARIDATFFHCIFFNFNSNLMKLMVDILLYTWRNSPSRTLRKKEQVTWHCVYTGFNLSFLLNYLLRDDPLRFPWWYDVARPNCFLCDVSSVNYDALAAISFFIRV